MVRVFSVKIYGSIMPNCNSGEIDRVAREALKAKEAGDDVRFIIYINSPGGDAYEMHKTIKTMDEMKKVGIEVVTINIGAAYSAAGTIFINGSKRLMAKHADLMLHEVRTAPQYAEETELREYLMEYCSGCIERLVSNLTKMGKEETIEWLSRDKHLGTDEAIKLNLADSVI